MGTAVVVVVVLVVGLPVVAVCVARLPVWDRLEPGTPADHDPWPFVRDLHRLDGFQLHEVARVVGRNELWPTGPPDDETIRAAAVSWMRFELGWADREDPQGIRAVLHVLDAPTRHWLRRSVRRFGGDPTPLRPPPRSS